MNELTRIKKVSLLIFLIPFLSTNVCLVLSQIFPLGEVFAIGDAISEDWRPWIIPYIDGHSSISRVVRVFPNTLIFKPSMLLTSILLIIYWVNIKNLIKKYDPYHRNINKIFFCGILSAVFLAIHSIFLGIKFDADLYKLTRRVILLAFIILEVAAQAYLIFLLFEIKSKIKLIINSKVLIIKRILILILIGAAILIAPFLPFTNIKIIKHILDWNYFLGVITFYFLSSLMWVNNKS